MFKIIRRRELQDRPRSFCQIIDMKPKPVPHVTRRNYPLADGYATQRNPEEFRFESTIKQNNHEKRENTQIVYRQTPRPPRAGA